MESTEYNGWVNYETWLAALWLDNTSETYHYWRERACNEPMHVVADALKEAHEDGFDETVGLYADLINAALSRINWFDIVKHLSST